MFSHALCQKSATREAFCSGDFNLGLQGFHGSTWKNGFIQRSKDGVKGPFYEMLLVPTSTSSTESHIAAIIPHSCAFMCSYSPNMGITGIILQTSWAPLQSPFLGTVFCQDRKLPYSIFQEPLPAWQSEIRAVTHLGFLSYFVNFFKFLLLSPPFKHPFKGEMKSNHLQRK